MKEKSYPIWSISAKWDQDNFKGNFTGFTIGFKRKLSKEDVMKYANDWWKDYLQEEDDAGIKLKDKNPVNLKINVKFLGNQTWWLEWFNHKTYNYFDNEKDAFNSFEKFLESKNVNLNYVYSNYNLEWFNHYDSSVYMAMGGEDRWRWKFCGCEKCKKLKISIIQH